MRATIRLRKNNWVKRYFTFRINRAVDPYRVVFRRQPYRILLVLSHMRSGSSLLTHLLNANPEVIGYGETHLTYQQPQDFKELFLRVYLRSQEFRSWKDIGNFQMQHQYVMDKILHNARIGDDSLLTSQQIYSLFLLREPQRSLASLLDLKAHWGETEALNYYQDRLATLVQYARLIRNSQRSLVITYDQILDDTPSILTVLKTFLQTTVPFSEEYPILRTTGQKGVGDPKGSIKAGKIIRQPRPLSQQLSSEVLEQAQDTYQGALKSLSQLCLSVST